MYVTATMVALLAFASLAVDLGRVYVVRSELQLAADAAARYGISGLGSGVSTAESYAITAAGDNKADGSAVVITSADIEFGIWNPTNKTFAVLTGPARTAANAMRVTARRTSANGGGVPLMFARVLGKTSQNAQATSVAYLPPRTPAGIIGYASITMKNNTFIAAYNSATTTNPTAATASSVGTLSSNGTITGGNNNELLGGINLGPSAPDASGIDVSGTTTYLASPLVPPAAPAWAPVANPNGLPQNYAANGNVTLPGGTYWFTSLTVDGTLKFSSAATLYINGPVVISGSLQPQSLIPADLKIYQLGDEPFGDDNANGMDVIADLVAPDSEFLAKNKLKFRGRMIVKSIELKNNADLFYDVALGTSTGGSGGIVTVR